MKLVFCLSLLITLNSYAKDVKDLNKALLQDLTTDIQKDDEKFRRNPVRGPASVQDYKIPKIEEPQKIDKNVRQIGPNEW
jgi:hypothetical protein